MAVDLCYPANTDWGCAYSVEELIEMRANPDTSKTMERSEALAWNTLQALLGYRLALCPTVIRPCLARCQELTWDEAPVGGPGPFHPFIRAGRWYNACGCQKDTCSCTSLCEVILPNGAGKIDSVKVDGVELARNAYVVHDGNRLVRVDGDCWPSCQDMTTSDDEEGSFVVSYYQGIAPNDLVKYAAGVLATEFFKACTGKNCRLPNGVTNITQNGVTMEIPTGLFPGGGTGIREVDTVIRIYNPNALKSQPRVLSPDSRRARTETWRVV